MKKTKGLVVGDGDCFFCIFSMKWALFPSSIFFPSFILSPPPYTSGVHFGNACHSYIVAGIGLFSLIGKNIEGVLTHMTKG